MNLKDMLEEISHELAVLCDEAVAETARRLKMEGKKNVSREDLSLAERFALECWAREITGSGADKTDIEEILQCLVSGQ